MTQSMFSAARPQGSHCLDLGEMAACLSQPSDIQAGCNFLFVLGLMV